MDPAVRCVRRVLVAAMLVCMGVGGAPAQEPDNGPRGYDAAGQPVAPAEGAAANGLEGVGGNPEALLGAPAALDDPYGSAYDTPGPNDAMRNAQRVPRGGLAAGRYGPQPAVRGNAKRNEQAPPAGAGNAPRDARADKADPGTRTPMGSALAIYHGPADGATAAGQVYKMPW